MRSFEERLDEFDARRVRVVAISVDPPEINRDHAHRQGFTFTFLSDPKAEVIRRYDLVHAGAGPEGSDIARPAEFLIDSTGTVRWANLTGSFVVRARPAEILRAVDDLGLPHGCGTDGPPRTPPVLTCGERNRIVPTPPLVSIVIPTYDREDLVAQAIDSALAQTHPRCEVVVVDDGSRDRTGEVLARYAGRILSIGQENKGLAGGRNTGIRASSGEFVGFLDSDDLWEPRLVEEALKVFSAHPEVGAVFLAERVIDLDGRIRGKVHTKRTPGRFFTPEGMIGRDTGVGSGRPPIARRQLLAEKGLFDESVRNFADCEMWIRHSFHFAMAILDEPLVLRRVHPGNVSADLAKDAELWLRILDDVERDHPEFAASHGALMRRTRGKQHLRIGREYLARSRRDRTLLSEARRHLREAVRLWPRFHRAWTYLAWSSIAPRTYGAFRDAEVKRR